MWAIFNITSKKQDKIKPKNKKKNKRALTKQRYHRGKHHAMPSSHWETLVLNRYPGINLAYNIGSYSNFPLHISKLKKETRRKDSHIAIKSLFPFVNEPVSMLHGFWNLTFKKLIEFWEKCSS